MLAVDKSSAFLKGVPQNAGSFLQGTVQLTRRRAAFTNRLGVLKSDPRLRPACSKPHIRRTCLNVKVVAAEMANLITVLFGGVNCRKEMIFHVKTVVFLYNAKLETHTKDDYCFIVIPK